MDARLLRQAACHGPEFVAEVLQLEAVLHNIAETMATQQGVPLDLLPPRQPPSVPHPHALPPT